MVVRRTITDGTTQLTIIDVDSMQQFVEIRQQLDELVSYGFIMPWEMMTKLTNFPPQWAIMVPLSDYIPWDTIWHLKIWLVIDDDNYCINEFFINKLVLHHDLNLIIKHFNRSILTPLLVNVGTIINVSTATDQQIIDLKLEVTDLYRYHDYIIEPLNPLMQDLDIDVYNIFELDKFKYDQYEAAIDIALQDLITVNIKAPSVVIIGGGKGGIVERIMNYTDNFTIIEKNPKVIPTLQHKFGINKVIHGDVRSFDINMYDIVVSEMIGSFGCNEMFPEVLQTVNNKIVIPSIVETFIQLIYSPIKYNKPFLNNIKQYYPLTTLHKLWDFSYPGENEINKCAKLSIPIKVGGDINYIMGVFDSDLYGGVRITNLKTRNHCSSWFPILFPIDTLKVNEGDIIEVTFWRIEGLTYKWQVNHKVYEYNVH